MRRITCQRRRGGFTLVEVAMAIAVISIGVTALLTAVAAGTRSNAAGKELTQASFLAQEIREWTLRLPFSDPDTTGTVGPESGEYPQTAVDDLDDLMNVTFSPPRDGQGSAITDMSDWSETISITWRNASSLTAVVTAGSTDFVYVQVVIKHFDKAVLTTGWIVTQRTTS